MISRRRALGTLACGLAGAADTSRAQPRVPRIAFLSAGVWSTAGCKVCGAFTTRLAALGYEDGRNLAIEGHGAGGDYDKLLKLAADLARRRVDIILPTSTPAVYAAKVATSTIPIVMTSSFDAQVAGLVDDLAHPGANITGLTAISFVLIGKRLQLLREAVPALTRMAYLDRVGPLPAANSEFAQLLAALNAEITRGVDRSAQRLGISVANVAADSPDDLPALFASLAKARVQALYVLEAPRLMIHRAAVADLALRHRLPTICGNPEFAEAGGLMSFNADFNDGWAKAATYVDRILKGAKPGDLPIEQPTRFQFVVNMKTARVLGLKIPQSLRLQADEVIE